MKFECNLLYDFGFAMQFMGEFLDYDVNFNIKYRM